MGYLFQYHRQVVRWESGRRKGGVGWGAGTREGKSVSGRETQGHLLEGLSFVPPSMLIGAWLTAILAGERDLLALSFLSVLRAQVK